MHCRLGHTRFVLLWQDKAIKVGRIRPLRMLSRLLLLPLSKRYRDRFFKKYGRPLLQALVRDLCAGRYANQNEYAYWQSSRNPHVMPTTNSYLFGWVIIQNRGEPVTTEDVHNLILRPLEAPSSCEMSTSTQFARDKNGRVLLVDYGNMKTITYLQEVT